VSAAVVEARPRERAGRTGTQPPLFHDLRRAPGSRPAVPPDTDWDERGPAGDPGERRPRSGGGRLTLEGHLGRTWEGLLAAGVAECAVCGGALEWTGEHGACGDCGSVLS
jgi:hypothetical protein